MRTELLESECDAALLVVEVEDHHVDLVVEFHHLLRMAHAAVAQVGDMDQAVHAAEIHEHTITGDVLHGAFQHLAFLEAADDLLLLCFDLRFDQCLVRDHHVLELLVDLHDLELHVLAHVLIVVADRLHVDLAAGQESLDAEHVHDEAALGAALHVARDDLVGLHRTVHLAPGIVDARGLVGDDHLAGLVLLLLDVHLHLVADGEVGLVTELAQGHNPLALVSDVDHRLLFVQANDGSHQHFLLGDAAEGVLIPLFHLGPLSGFLRSGVFEGVPIKIRGRFGEDDLVVLY